MPRSESISSSLDLSDTIVAFEEQRPKENNGAFADRIHANILLEGVIVELFRGDSGYEGIESSKEMIQKVGTVEGSLAVVGIEDLGVKGLLSQYGHLASVSLASSL